MNLLTKRTLSVAAATAAMTVAALAQSGVAHAFLITRTNGPTPVNPSLSPPTVIDFDFKAPPAPVPTTPTAIAPGGPNGGATIQNTAGAATYQGNQLEIGGNNDVTGIVSFVFDDPRGMGYLGLQWQNPRGNEFISFFNAAGTLIGTELSGLEVVADAFGNGNYFNFFVTNNSEIFTRVDFRRAASNGNSFLIDDLAYQAIPTPALLPGLVALGIGAVRKRKAEAEAEAEA